MPAVEGIKDGPLCITCKWMKNITVEYGRRNFVRKDCCFNPKLMISFYTDDAVRGKIYDVPKPQICVHLREGDTFIGVPGACHRGKHHEPKDSNTFVPAIAAAIRNLKGQTS